jgi:hypothetical protein
MADVTSTARLIVTVEGEGKIKALAAQIKALQGLSGSKRIGGITGPAQMVAQNASMKRAATQMAASQAVTGRLMKPMQAQISQTAKIVAPLAAQQAALAKTTSNILKTEKASAADMARAQAARARVMARQKEVYPTNAPAAAGITDKLLKSIQKRNLGMSEEEARRAATGGTRSLPKINKRDYAAAVGQGWMTREAAAAGVAALAAKPAVATAAAKAAAAASTPSQRLAAGGRTGAAGKMLGGLGNKAVGAIESVGGAYGAGMLARGLGAASAAAVPLAAAAGTMAVGFKAANAQAEDLVTNTGKAMKKRREVDEIEARQAAGESVFGKAFESLEKGVPKLLSAQRAKRGIAGEKGIMGRLGLSQEQIVKAEKAGKKLDAYGIGEILAKKREQLEQAVTGAPTPKAKAAAQKKLDQFWKDVGLLPEGYTRAAAFGSKALEQNRKNQEEIQRSYGAGLADEKKQLQDAQNNILLRGQIASQFKEGMDRIGTFSMPGVNDALREFNAKMMQIGPGLSEALGRLSGIGWQAIAAGIKSIDGSWLATQLEKINVSLRDFKIEDMSVEGVTQQLQEQFNKMMKSAFEGMTSGEGSANLADFIAKDFTEKFWPSVMENIRRLKEMALPEVKVDADQPVDEYDMQRRQAATKGEPPKVIEAPGATVNIPEWKRPPEQLQPTVSSDFPGGVPTPRARPTGAPQPPALPTTAAPGLVPDQGAFTAAGSAGGKAFSDAAASGITTAGSAGGKAFSSGINASQIGGAIGSAAAKVISAAKVTVNVQGAVNAAGGGGGRTAPASKGTDTSGGND